VTSLPSGNPLTSCPRCQRRGNKGYRIEWVANAPTFPGQPAADPVTCIALACPEGAHFHRECEACGRIWAGSAPGTPEVAS
jgi:ferredoxin